MREVSKNLGVRYVLEGSVRKSGARVRITAQLIDAATGGHLWAERFDRDLTDIFAVQDDVTTQIVAALALNLSASDRQNIAVEQSDNLDAYDCFLRGRELWYRQTRDLNVKALEMLTRAIEIDENFTSAYAFIAIAHMRDYLNQWSKSPSLSLRKGYEVAQRAVSVNDRDPYAHWALGSLYLWMRRHDEAIAELRRSVSLNPNFAMGNALLGLSLHYAGESDRALEYLERAIALDPYADVFLHFEAQAYFQLNRYQKAIEILKRRVTRNPETDISRVLLASSYGHVGLIEEAREAWRSALRVNPAYSLEHRRNVLPYRNPDDFERLVEGLRKAGLPEQ